MSIDSLYELPLYDDLININTNTPQFKAVVGRIKTIQKVIQLDSIDIKDSMPEKIKYMLPGLFIDDVIYVLDIIEDKIISIAWKEEYMKKPRPSAGSKNSNIFSYREYWKSKSHELCDTSNKQTGFFFKMSTNMKPSDLNEVMPIKINRLTKYTYIYMLCALVICKWYDGKIIQDPENKWFSAKMQQDTSTVPAQATRFQQRQKAQSDKVDSMAARLAALKYICFDKSQDFKEFRTTYSNVINSVQTIAPRVPYTYNSNDFLVARFEMDTELAVKNKQSTEYYIYYKPGVIPPGSKKTNTSGKYVLNPEYKDTHMIFLKCVGKVEATKTTITYKMNCTHFLQNNVEDYDIYILSVYSFARKGDDVQYYENLTHDLYHCPFISDEFVIKSFYYPDSTLIVLRDVAADMTEEAYKQSKILGFAIIYISEYNDDRMFKKVATLKVLCSREKKISLGVGSALMTYLEQTARKSNCDAIDLDALVGAVMFYVKMDYQFTTPLESDWFRAMYAKWNADTVLRAKYKDDLEKYFTDNPGFNEELAEYRAKTPIPQLELYNQGQNVVNASILELKQLMLDVEYTKAYPEMLFHMRKNLKASSGKRLKQ